MLARDFVSASCCSGVVVCTMSGRYELSETNRSPLAMSTRLLQSVSEYFESLVTALSHQPQIILVHTRHHNSTVCSMQYSSLLIVLDHDGSIQVLPQARVQFGQIQPEWRGSEG